MAVTLPAAVSTTNVDSGTLDTPKNARADIKTMFDAWNTVRAQIDALGIMQVGDGVENEAQSAGTKDKLRIKLNGSGITSGLDRSASGLKIAAAGVTAAMLAQNSATSGQVMAWNGSAWAAATITSGEVNTSSNVGSGSQIAKAKVGFDLPFRTLKVAHAIYLDGALNNTTGAKPAGSSISSSSISIAQNTDDVTVTLRVDYVTPPGGE